MDTTGPAWIPLMTVMMTDGDTIAPIIMQKKVFQRIRDEVKVLEMSVTRTSRQTQVFVDVVLTLCLGCGVCLRRRIITLAKSNQRTILLLLHNLLSSIAIIIISTVPTASIEYSGRMASVSWNSSLRSVRSRSNDHRHWSGYQRPRKKK